jgi:hypothetical protein
MAKKKRNIPTVAAAYFEQYDAPFFWVTEDGLVFLPEKEAEAQAHGKAVGGGAYKAERPERK